MPHDKPVPIVSAVIVTRDSADLAWGAKRSFEAAFEGLPVETIVVDNASRDPRFPPDAVAIRNERNTGFGAGCNAGAAVARSPVLLFLNPDARLGAGRWRDLLAYFESHAEVAAIGVRRTEAGGERVPQEVPPDVTLWSVLCDVAFAGARRRGGRPARAGLAFEPVAWLPASCLFVRRRAFAAIGGFDESFFLYFEDVDLCRRLRLERYEVLLAHGAQATHPEAGHEKYHDQRRIESYYAGLLAYFAKWSRRALPVVRLLALSRLGSRAVYWTYRRVIRRLTRADYRERMAGYRAAARAVLLGGVRPARKDAVPRRGAGGA